MANEEATVVNPEPAAQAAAPAPTPDESTQTPVVEEKDAAVDTGEYSVNDAEEESKPADPAAAEDTDESSKPSRGAEKRKEQLRGEINDLKQELEIDPNTEIRDLVSARNALKRQVEQANAQAYRPATEQELLDQVNPETGDYFTPLEAKVAALEHQQKLERYNQDVTEAQLTVTTEAQRAIHDFPMFDSESPDYNPEVAARVDKILGDSLVFDQATGQIVGSHVSPYQLYKTVHDAYQASAVEHQLRGQKSTEAMLASADNVGGAPQKETPFEKLSLDEMRTKLRAKGHDV